MRLLSSAFGYSEIAPFLTFEPSCIDHHKIAAYSAVPEMRMADEALARYVATLSAVFIFGGDIMPAEDREHLGGVGWRSLRGLERDKTGPMPSYERVLAGECLYRMNPRLRLIPSGGKSNLEEVGGGPFIARVMADELQELGVPSTAIIEETQSFRTQDHLLHCSAIARERHWTATEIGILAPFWQFGRITAMMIMRAEEYEPIDPFVLGVTPLISVERVLASDDPVKWNTYFTNLYCSSAMAHTFVSEAVGVGQLRAGHAPKSGAPYAGFLDPLGSIRPKDPH
jgi:DUF218 domain